MRFSFAVTCRIFAISSSVLSGMLMLYLYSQYLVPEIYGVILVGLQLLNYLPFLDGGFRSVINRRILAQTGPEKALIQFGQTFYTFLALVAGLGGVLVMGVYSFFPPANSSGISVLFFLALGLSGAFSFIASSQMGLLIGLGQQGIVFVITGIASWINLLVLWFLLKNEAWIWGFPISLAAASGSTYAISIILIKKQVPFFKAWCFKIDSFFRETFGQLKKEAWAWFKGQVSIVLLYTMDIVLVGLVGTAKDAAVYGVVSRLFTLLRSLLQSTGEAAWPIIAQKGLNEANFSGPLIRINAWAYGSFFGSAFVILIPFLTWFLEENWVPSPFLLHLIMIRCLITGLSTPTSYFLFGMGKIELISRFIQREFLAGTILAIGLGWLWGAEGVALGFLLATPLGTLLPLPYFYCQTAGQNFKRLLGQVFVRVLISFLAGAMVTSWAYSFLGPGWKTILAALIGVSSGLAIALLHSMFRFPIQIPTRPGQLLQILKRI